jgi:hypothetical protein
MRHQRAAAGWSSRRGAAAAADRTSWVASKPARVRLFNRSTRSGIEGSAVALGLLWQEVAAIAGLRRCPRRVACRVANARLGPVRPRCLAGDHTSIDVRAGCPVGLPVWLPTLRSHKSGQIVRGYPPPSGPSMRLRERVLVVPLVPAGAAVSPAHDCFFPNSAQQPFVAFLRWPGRIWMKPNVLNSAVVAVLRCCTDHLVRRSREGVRGPSNWVRVTV